MNRSKEFQTDRFGKKLVILDDFFPHLLSAFRIAEYNEYLKNYKDSEVHSTASTYKLLGDTRGFQEVLDEYGRLFPQFRDRVFQFDPGRGFDDAVAYTVFLSNVFFFLDIIEKYRLPFVFTLYPGGGFLLDHKGSDNKLRLACASPNFRKVIVTQNITRDYIISKSICNPDKIEFVYGVVLQADHLAGRAAARARYGQDKETFDICFVAQKYMRGGLDKGYDVFIAVAKLLAGMHPGINFHVVGGFNESDLDVSDLKDRIRFYGLRRTGFFPQFYSRMDLILSPNVPFTLHPGAFDGFPTGCCIEAGLCGTPVFCTDILNQNIAFKEGEEIVLISRDAGEIVDIIDHYYRDYEALCELGRRGQEAFRRVIGLENQMRPRLKVLSDCMADDGSSGGPPGSADDFATAMKAYRDWFHQLDVATEEVRALIPAGDSFILADQDEWGTDGVVSGRRALPFLEQSGRYAGPPPDDEMAIRGLERLRQAGANFMVFAWPAFWWLDYYCGLRHHIRSEYPCLLENDRLIVFDLRPLTRSGGEMASLRSEITGILNHIPIDFGGGCSADKAYMMAWLIRRYNLKTTVDIGVYRGRSLFPQAWAHRQHTGGVVYGVDPWSAAEVMQHDDPTLSEAIERFVNPRL